MPDPPPSASTDTLDLGDLVEGLTRPAAFLHQRLRAVELRALWPLAALAGLGTAVSSLDQQLLVTRLAVEANPAFVVEASVAAAGAHWLGFWGVAAMTGVLWGLFTWFVLGWFYTRRLVWCGVAEPDPVAARKVAVFVAWPQALPAVMHAMGASMVVSAPDAAVALPTWSAAAAVGALAELASIRTSWAAAAGGLFGELDPRRARLWFLWLPGIRAAIMLASALPLALGLVELPAAVT